MGDTVLYQRREAIGTITLSRPQVLNAINDDWIVDLLSAAREARADTEARVVIVKGEGRAFCAGADLKEGPKQYENLLQYREAHMDPEQDISRVFRLMGKPVLGQIHGYAVGGGCELAMLCDMRIAAEETRFGFTEVRVGATVTLGGHYNLPRIVGLGRAFELLYSTELIDAREAWRIGLVNQVVPAEVLDEQVTTLAERIAGYFPHEVAMTRSALYHALDSDYDTALDAEESAAIISYAAGSRAVGMTAAMEQIQRRKERR